MFAERAAAILNGARPLDVLGGYKVRSFYRNITGDTEAVTVDVWAHRAALGDITLHANRSSSLLRNGKRYRAIANAYRQVAPDYGLRPSEFQAATWVAVRGAST
jgi:hypothetical protein